MWLQQDPRRLAAAERRSLMNDVQSYTAVLMLTIVALATWMSSPAFAAIVPR
jgi:hypothetical protein